MSTYEMLVVEPLTYAAGAIRVSPGSFKRVREVNQGRGLERTSSPTNNTSEGNLRDYEHSFLSRGRDLAAEAELALM